jgi:hypothetical protein
MKIVFRTKEEANAEQEADFLSLAPEDRFYQFLFLSRRILRFPSNQNQQFEEKGNFVISFNTHGKRMER